MTMWNNSQKPRLGPARTPQFRCLYCTSTAWHTGGSTALAHHLRQHDIHSAFPRTQPADEQGQPLDVDGAPADLDPLADGLIRTRLDRWGGQP